MNRYKHAAIAISSSDQEMTSKAVADVTDMFDALGNSGEDCPAFDTFDQPIGVILALAAWANRALASMDAQEDWGADLLDSMAEEAIDMGLAVTDKNGMFRMLELK